MNEILVIRHYGTQDLDFTGECDTEIILNGVSIIRGDTYHDKIESYLEGFREAIKFTNTFHSYKEQNVNDAEHWD